MHQIRFSAKLKKNLGFESEYAESVCVVENKKLFKGNRPRNLANASPSNLIVYSDISEPLEQAIFKLVFFKWFLWIFTIIYTVARESKSFHLRCTYLRCSTHFRQLNWIQKTNWGNHCYSITERSQLYSTLNAQTKNRNGSLR